MTGICPQRYLIIKQIERDWYSGFVIAGTECRCDRKETVCQLKKLPKRLAFHLPQCPEF